MKSIYDVIVEDLGSKKAWGNLVYNDIGRDKYNKVLYSIRVAAAKEGVQTGQQPADNGQLANTYPVEWLRVQLNAELAKLGLNVQIKGKELVGSPLDLLEKLYDLATVHTGYGRWTLSKLGKGKFYDRHAFNVFYHILKLNIENGFDYVTEHEVRTSMDNKQMRAAVSKLRRLGGWNILTLHGLGYKVGLRDTDLDNPLVELANEIVSSFK